MDEKKYVFCWHAHFGLDNLETFLITTLSAIEHFRMLRIVASSAVFMICLVALAMNQNLKGGTISGFQTTRGKKNMFLKNDFVVKIYYKNPFIVVVAVNHFNLFKNVKLSKYRKKNKSIIHPNESLTLLLLLFSGHAAIMEI